MPLLSRKDATFNLILGLIGFLTLWFLITVNEDLGKIYGFMLGFGALLFLNLQLSGGSLFNLIQDSLNLQDIAFGAFLWAIYIVISGVLLAAYSGQGFSVNSAIKVQESTTPVFQGNQFFSFVGWGMLIPFIETVMLFSIWLNLARAWGIDVNSLNFNNLLLIAAMVILFMFFHLEVEAIIGTGGELSLNNVSFLQHGIFAAVTLVGATLRKPKELSPFYWMHSIGNSAALALRWALLPFGG